MYNREKRARFVLLRAQGVSIRAIADELKISTSTVWNWNGEHADEIYHLTQSGIAMTLSEMGVDKNGRLKTTAGVINYLRESIEQDIAEKKIPDQEKVNSLIKLYSLICKDDPSTGWSGKFSERPKYGMFLQPEPDRGIMDLCRDHHEDPE